MFSLLMFLFMQPVGDVPAAVDPESAAVKVTRSVEPRLFNGSGTVVHCDGQRSFVLTNRHVCPRAEGAIEVRAGNWIGTAKFIAADPVADLAMLSVDAKLPVAQLAKDDPLSGDDLRQWGFPSGKREPKEGRSAGMLDVSEGGHKMTILTTSIPIAEGDSGSGVFNAKGHLVGVAYAAAVHSGGVKREHCVGLPDIRRFVARWSK